MKKITIMSLFALWMLMISAAPKQKTSRGLPVGGTRATAVDMGLSVKWADHNLGASRATDYGKYFAWGALRPSAEYIDTLCPTWERNFDYTEVAADTLYDAAIMAWGSEWRMPTSSELKELIDSCTWTFTSAGGVKGYRVTGPSGGHIFLPAAGYKIGRSLLFNGQEGMYWSAEPIGTRLAGILRFDDNSHSWFNFSRSSGLPIRPVYIGGK